MELSPFGMRLKKHVNVLKGMENHYNSKGPNFFKYFKGSHPWLFVSSLNELEKNVNIRLRINNKADVTVFLRHKKEPEPEIDMRLKDQSVTKRVSRVEVIYKDKDPFANHDNKNL